MRRAGEVPVIQADTVFNAPPLAEPPALVPAPPPFRPECVTLGALIDGYLEDYDLRQFRTKNTAAGRVAHLRGFFGTEHPAAAINAYAIRQYQMARRQEGAAAATVNRETSCLSRMLKLAIQWEWLATAPVFPGRLRENPPRQGFFEHHEYLAVRGHLQAPYQDVLDFAYLLRVAQAGDPAADLA